MAEDGTWRVSGTKIFITWGDHDLTQNIVHFVLARSTRWSARHPGDLALHRCRHDSWAPTARPANGTTSSV